MRKYLNKFAVAAALALSAGTAMAYPDFTFNAGAVTGNALQKYQIDEFFMSPLDLTLVLTDNGPAGWGLGDTLGQSGSHHYEVQSLRNDGSVVAPIGFGSAANFAITGTLSGLSGTWSSTDAAGNQVFTLTSGLLSMNIVTTGGGGVTTNTVAVWKVTGQKAVVDLTDPKSIQLDFSLQWDHSYGPEVANVFLGVDGVSPLSNALPFFSSVFVFLPGMSMAGNQTTLVANNTGVGNVTLGPGSPVPEPGTLAVLGLGLVAVAGLSRRRFMAY